jgi:glucose-1-phosphate thymidylyltransferase
MGKARLFTEGATLRGPVVIGEYSDIGTAAYVRPYTSVGSHVKILGAEIENSIILDVTVVDCRERIVDSIIAKNS